MMMRTVVVLAVLAPFASAHSRQRDYGEQSFRLMAMNRGNMDVMSPEEQKEELVQLEIEQAYAAAAPLSANEGVSSFGLALIWLATGAGTVASLSLLENRRKDSADAWLADDKTFALYRWLSIISVMQAGFAVLRIFDSTAFFSGLLDLFSAGLSFNLTQGGALSYLPTYLLCAGFASVVDILVLLWDFENWNGSLADVIRPCLCWAGIVLGYRFLQDVRQFKGKGQGAADKMLDMVLSSELVQQAVCAIGMVDIDPLLSSGLPTCNPSTQAAPILSSTAVSDILKQACHDPEEPLETEVTEVSAPILSSSAVSDILMSACADPDEPLDTEVTEVSLPMISEASINEVPEFQAEFASDELEDDLL